LTGLNHITGSRFNQVVLKLCQLTPITARISPGFTCPQTSERTKVFPVIGEVLKWLNVSSHEISASLLGSHLQKVKLVISYDAATL